MNRFATGICLASLAVAAASPADASPCGDQAMRMFKAYGLSETSNAGQIPPGDSAGGSRASGVPSGLSDGKQLSPINQQSVSLLVKQAVQADQTGDTATCKAKLSAARVQIRTGS